MNLNKIEVAVKDFPEKKVDLYFMLGTYAQESREKVVFFGIANWKALQKK